MAKSSRQKLKLLYLRDFLLRNSDEAHPVTIRDMIAHLAQYGISAERKSLYSDLNLLQEYGMDIVRVANGYYVVSRDFELPELKLLVDSVQSSKFITQKKTAALIHKLETLASIHEAKLLNRQVYVLNRIKSMNESIYYNVDAIHSGIAQNRQIQFHYFEYNLQKEPVFRKNGQWYMVSPYALTWDDENYYLVAFDAQADKLKHYRVDKMTHIAVTDQLRLGADAFAALEIGSYARKMFGMFSGQMHAVTLRVANHLVGAMLDRFGKELSIIPDGGQHFTVQVEVAVSPQFFGWLCAFGADMKILAPEDVIGQFRRYLEDIRQQYLPEQSGQEEGSP